MSNNNIINIALNYHKKKEQRKRKAQRLNEVTELCKKNNKKYHANIDIGICISGYFFKMSELDKAMIFIESELSLYDCRRKNENRFCTKGDFTRNLCNQRL